MQAGTDAHGVPSSCDVSDVCDDLGVPAVRTGALRPAWPGAPGIAGRVVTIALAPGNDAASDPIAAVVAVLAATVADIAVIDLGGRLDVQCWGSVLAAAARSHGVRGALVNGAVRDVEALAALRYPTFARGVTPVRARGRLTVVGVGRAVDIDGQIVAPGSFVVADGSGAVFFPARAAGIVVGQAHDRARREREHLTALWASPDPGGILSAPPTSSG